MEATNQLKLYSINSAARVLCLGKDTVYRLVAAGKIGYIEIGKRKKIPYNELVRFQNESIKHEPIQLKANALTKAELNNMFGHNRKNKVSANGHAILENLLRS